MEKRNILDEILDKTGVSRNELEFMGDIVDQLEGITKNDSKSVKKRADIIFKYEQDEKMYKLDNTIVDAVFISIDTQIDDSKRSPRHGGTQYLGYDFPVEKSKLTDMESFILEQMHEHNITYIRLFHSKEMKENRSNLFTKTDIKRCFYEHATKK